MVPIADVTVECNFAFDPANLSDFFGDIEVLDNCPDANKVEDMLVGELNTCGSGTLLREIRLFNPQGVQVDYQEQLITFENGDALTYDDITPPSASLDFDGCGFDAIAMMDADIPIVPTATCQQVGISVVSDTFPFTETDGACLKIIRTFSVIDWCISDGPGSIGEPFEFEQIIKVNNTSAPEMENVFEDSTYCSFAVDCGGLTLTGLTADVFDDCTSDSELINRFQTFDSEGELVRSGFGLDASGYYDLGTYTVRFISEDKCGNQTTRESGFTIMSCKQPTPYCLSGLSTTLTAMDTDGDGTADAEQVMLTPSYFDAGSYHPCGYDVALSFSADLDDTLAVFFCSDTLGLVDVELWVTALDADGNALPNMSSFCVTELDVQNNEDIDLCSGMTPSIIGRIYTSADAQLNEAKVQLISEETIIDMTNESGEYEFLDMPSGGDYTVAPEKNDDVLNGVTTLDLVMIQRHLLGIAEFDEVYKYIAADINNDEKLKASDLLALRKVILGINSEFPNNTSWRFIDESHEFVNETNPWATVIPESYDIVNLSEDMNIDFIAVKTGDINGSVSTNLQAGVIAETRSNEALIMSMPNAEVTSGEVYEIEVTSMESLDMRGAQYAFNMEGLELMNIIPGVMNISRNEYIVQDEMLKVSYANAVGDYIQPEARLYTIVVRALEDGQLSEMISITEKAIVSESYLGQDLKVGGVEIEWRDEDSVVPVELLVAQNNSPNPWRNWTEINFEIPSAGTVSLTIKDASGRLLVKKSAEFGIGSNTFTITNEDVKQSGVLLYELKYGEQVINKKMIRIE